MTFSRRAELQDISDQNADRARTERNEYITARNRLTEWERTTCPNCARYGIACPDCAGEERDRD